MNGGVDGDKIYLGHLEHGEPVNLEIGKEISSMSRSQSQDIFATRLYAFGSSRNLPSDYRKGETGAVVEGVVPKKTDASCWDSVCGCYRRLGGRAGC